MLCFGDKINREFFDENNTCGIIFRNHQGKPTKILGKIVEDALEEIDRNQRSRIINVKCKRIFEDNLEMILEIANEKCARKEIIKEDNQEVVEISIGDIKNYFNTK